MKKSRIILACLAFGSCLGITAANKIQKDCELYLFYRTIYQGIEMCLSEGSLTTTTTTTGLFPLPTGATGWFTRDDCLGNTFKAKVCLNNKDIGNNGK